MKNTHDPSPLSPSAHPTTEETTPDSRPLVERIRMYFAWCEDPQFNPCPRCSGKGYHHGFGKGGVDPDWCIDCGGPGQEPTEPGTWCSDDLLREALELLAATQPATEVSPAPAASPALKEKPQTDSHEALVEALQLALDHVSELREAWARGVLREGDTLGGMRSNRNVDVESAARAALQKAGVTK